MRKFLAVLSLIFAGTACAFIASCTNKNTVSISFDVNGGEEISDIVKQPGEEVTLPDPEGRSGYEFEGWYLDVDFSGDPVKTVTVTENTTYYAKWAQLYTITLDLNGGNLSTKTLGLKAGANVYDFMLDYVPTKSGLTFGAWFNGDAELARNTRMPESGLSLTAKYKVGYRVEVYKQNVEGTEYLKDSEDVSGSDYIGATVAPEYGYTGFTLVEHTDEVTEKVLSETASDNVLKLYYDREEYTVNFVSNYPDGTNDSRSSVAKYGTEVELPIDFTFEGYCLVGYSSTQNGEVEYAVNYVDTVLYNKEDASTVENAKFSPERNTSLYAVWSKGYTDMFGGNDYIFVLDEQSEVAYLARGNVFFKGDFRPLTKGFTIDAKTFTLEGKLNSDGTFVYSSEDRAKTYYLYTPSANTEVDKNTKVVLDPYSGLEYIVTKEDVTSTSTGSYSIKDGMYYVSYTSGELAGTEAVMVIGTLRSGERAFQIRNEEEVNMGVIARLGITSGGSIGMMSNGMYGITLNGFGVATIKLPTQDYNYNYTLNEDKTQINLTSSFGMSAGVARIMEIDGFKGYMFYNEDLDVAIEQNGGSLTLDGVCRATYVKDGKTVSGYYLTAGTSVMGGNIVNVIADGVTYNLIVKSTTTQSSVDGNVQDVVVYSYEEKPATYAEYYYADAEGVYYHCLVLDDTQVGKASIYQRISQTEFAKVATGSYEYNAETETYSFTKEEYFAVEGASNTVIDMAAVKSFVFSTGTYTSTSSMGTTNTYEVHFWFSSKTEAGETDNTMVYTGSNGDKLTLVAGFAFYSKAGQATLSGMYSLSESGIMTINAGTVMYLRIDEDNKAFTALETAPATAYELKADGSYTRTDYLYFDGTKNGATYTYVDNDKTVTLEGTFAPADKATPFGYVIYTFTCNDTTFNFIRMSTSSNNFFAKYNEQYNGEYESADGEVLTLDGYNFMASLSLSGGTLQGNYMILSEKVISLHVSNTSLTLFFDLQDGKKFTVRGTEYGTYLLMNNNGSEGVFIELSGDANGGEGTAKVFTTKRENNETVREYIDENAIYSIADRLFTVKYTQNGAAKSIVGKLMTYTSNSGNFNAFVIIHDEVVQTYVNDKDYSILILDNSGGAVKYDSRGAREDGTYTLVTSNILSYVNVNGTDAYIYVYDTQKGTATTVSLTPVAYYSTEFEALQFNRFGIAIINGETRAYYSVDEAGEVTIYRLPEEGETVNVNEYGFVPVSFGKFNNTCVWEGVKYYKNNGYDLSFSRKDENKNNYPVLLRTEEIDGILKEYKFPLQDLTFTPSGAKEFSVSGTVTIADGNDQTNDSYNCTVVREIVNDVTETYVVIPLRMGYYRFDIELELTGDDNYGRSDSSYDVVGMSRVIEMPSYNYLYTYYIYSMFDSMLGTNMAASFENTLGTISIMFDYDEQGKVIGAVYDPVTGDLAHVKDEQGKDTDEYVNDGGYIKAEFGEDSGLFDADGNLLSISHGAYTVERMNGLNMYTVDFVGEDGYNYRLRFVYEAIQQLGAYGYRLYGMTRVQTLTFEDYTVEVERTIGSDAANMYRGGIMMLNLKQREEDIVMTSGIVKEDGSVIYVVRTFGEGDDKDKIISTKYYVIDFKEKTNEVVGDENDGKIIPVYESVKVSELQVSTVYSEDGKSYVDMAEDEIKLVYVNGRSYLVNECAYDSATGKYTIKTYASSFTVEIKEGKALITEIIEENSEENV